ncbi:Dyp-type peroxidase [Phytomonospora endophytica]|uniref:Dye decolorizing peroxidase n=1 Tax=Phytomonospora endophytica TaxID=714109 RepID=A0A841FD99_9ACTN|nr:Dyp-type peroxidase [Phytomonospora endophytica]MBB6034256.1 dye decolorizing peroxidase [Phytomonospora endophytica]GIG66648.1 peroxidase [Phytomonospora endophytica]
MTKVSRRGLLLGGAVGAGAAAAGIAAGRSLVDGPEPPPEPVTVEAFHGPRQAGIATEPQAHGVFCALDLREGTDRDATARLMRLLSDDAARLTRGTAALADTEPELATSPARLTVTFGFGPGLYAAAGLASPVAALPGFAVDRLEARWSGGDLLVQICGDDALTVAHAQRMLVKDARAFASVRWTQRGFRAASGTKGTQRNILGQLDGTGNPAAGTSAFDTAVWRPDGSTTLVVRRIRAELDDWAAVDRTVREMSVGRRLDTGAPLTGLAEHDEPDFAARDELGIPVIHPSSHVRLARVGADDKRILRRPYNYDEGPSAEGKPDTGLIFASYQADVERQFTPIQRALSDADLLNKWVTPIGSAVFAVPPGCGEGGWVGEGVLG